MKYLFSMVALFFVLEMSAQTENAVVIHKDPRIDVLIKKQAEVNDLSTRSATTRRSAKGYRLLVISTNSRDEAITAKTAIYNYFPELKAYMWHQSPYYKVKVGNFLTRNEAAAYQKKLSPVFPRGVFIMNDVIEIKPEDAAKLEKE
ncbi:MAG TPA: SPOR domain-containing protein [Niabella sp.]|jgi:hypothetical protein|nr:SPOR domain-containing protein [Chitinophagaceae bacterium]HRN49121.1 SPOR domain-containing protein [Niabella sp.]HRO86229.1 SPOR domain-containing protein [Niabella sp.]HUN03678.1 SPOR domain-containing protein [Niabella sp.]